MVERVQLSRKKGWRMPANTVSVARPTKWGNPWTVEKAREAGYQGTDREMRAMCVGMFESGIRTELPATEAHRRDIGELRGKNLACWCPLDHPCHADVLLRLANEECRTSEDSK